MRFILLTLLIVLSLNTVKAQNNYAGLSLGYSNFIGTTDISAYLGSSLLFGQAVSARVQVDVKTVIPGIFLGAGADVLYEFALDPLTIYVGAGPNLFFVPGSESAVFAYGAHATTGITYDFDFVTVFAEFQPSFFIMPAENASPGAGVITSTKIGVLFPF